MPHVLLIALMIYGQEPVYYVSHEMTLAECGKHARAWVAEQISEHILKVQHYRGAWRVRSKCVAVGGKGEHEV